MSRLFRRAVEVQIVKADEVEVVTTTIVGLRVMFNIEKQLTKEPNTCEIEISNLSEPTRAALQQKPLKLFLSAGYEDSLKQIFAGDIRWVESLRSRSGWTTKIQVGDGERAHRNSRSNKSFRGGASIRQVLKKITDDMGLKIPKNLDDVKELGGKIINGEVLQGLSSKSLDRVLRSKGLSYSIQDEKLQVLRAGEVRQDIALVVAQETGLIGVPGFGSPPQKDQPAMLRLDSLLYPEIIPGIKLDVKSKTVEGEFRAERVTHVGDTHGNEWRTSVEATSR